MRRAISSALALTLCLLASFTTSAASLPADLPARLAAAAPAADPAAIEAAVLAMQCAQSHGQGTGARRLTLIDYSRPSLDRRFWVFDLATGELLFEEFVAHGKNSGGNRTESFSNENGSLQTSLGLFLTGDTYQGANGYSLRMVGLDRGLNDRAFERAIVIHGAPYVDPDAGKKQGRLGRSHGCPALRSAVAKPVIDTIRRGNFVFSYHAGRELFAKSEQLKCGVALAGAARNGGGATSAVAAPTP